MRCSACGGRIPVQPGPTSCCDAGVRFEADDWIDVARQAGEREVADCLDYIVHNLENPESITALDLPTNDRDSLVITLAFALGVTMSRE